MRNPLRIAIADDQTLLREGLKSLVKPRPDLEVVAETDRMEDVPRMIEQTSCDVLLLNLQMDDCTLAGVGDLAARVPTVVAVASERPEDAVEAIRAGARGVLLKRFTVEELMRAIATVARGEVSMPPSVQGRMADVLTTPPEPPLTPREREVVRLVAFGLRNSEVAKKLFISELTVKTHLNNVFQKLGCRDRVELALWAARAGIIEVHERPPS